MLKQHRALATRYDKLALRYADTMPIAVINIWLRVLAARGCSARSSRVGAGGS
ncbi:hypothetical protein ACL02T_31635 [Pseudonocardia sp. RS010]|uniref:hypothetical protein n=1 Tax=Pseudonocardia sp. RS010 TaxID=3385979 RepID=UPI0039A15601